MKRWDEGFLGWMEIRLFSYHSSFVIFILEQMCGMLSMLLYQLLVNGDEMSLQCTFIGNSETQLVTGVRGMDNFLQFWFWNTILDPGPGTSVHWTIKEKLRIVIFQFYRNFWHFGLGAWGAGDAPDNHVEFYNNTEIHQRLFSMMH